MIICNRNVQLVTKKVVLVSVPTNHTIWLSFNSYRNERNQPLKVRYFETINCTCSTKNSSFIYVGSHSLRKVFAQIYDGPYWTSPLLLSHNGSAKPLSIRSSSNNLYIEFPEMYCPAKFVIDIDYTSVSKAIVNVILSHCFKCCCPA